MSDLIKRAEAIIEKYEKNSDDERREVVEALRIVVRGRKARLKLKCPPGLKQKGSACVPKSGKETVMRRIAARRGAIKRKPQQARINRKRKKSVAIRRNRGM